VDDFPLNLIRWQRQYGRHDLPWQGMDAYHVWVSEIMLQQTQVVTVIPYYQRFIAAFPDVSTLAVASEDQVLAHWSGLGYYARGRNLHKATQIITSRHGGKFPREFETIIALPGIGRSTAAAICALAYQEHRAILDGNVKRLLARYCGIEGWAGDRKVEDQLWQQAETLLPKHDVAIYTQALMDMGATVCTRSKPKCDVCPVKTGCAALRSDRVTELPTPRPRKAVSERKAIFLLLMHGNDIMLEKRPGSGIWGGLWCPPQLDDGQCVVDDYLQRSGHQVSERMELDEFTHTFTHFRLHISPVLLRLEKKPLLVENSGSIWLALDEAMQVAIPTPVRRMLKVLASGQ
jgi:A/G-specific adenine glycosylase